MPSITITRNGLPITYNVNYTTSISGTTSSLPTASASTYDNYYYVQTSFYATCSSGTSSTSYSTCQHGALDSLYAQTITATVSGTCYKGERTWNSGEWGSSQYVDFCATEDEVKKYVSTPTVKYTSTKVSGGWNVYKQNWVDGYYSYYFSTSSWSKSSSFSFYAPPSNFTFTNCATGKQWKIDAGLNSLITNISDFPLHAQKYKQWEHQTSQSACPSFFPSGSGSKLTATNLNAVYNYVKGTQPYSAGTKISAEMFNALASATNR